MVWDDAEATPKSRTPEIGADLSPRSLAELEDYLALLEAEMARVRNALAQKKASQQAADAFFRR
jgi:uncharacterized small protein (DUF1192 family)